MEWLILSIILAVGSLSAFLIKRHVRVEQLKAWSDIATIIGVIVAANIQLFIGWHTYNESDKTQKRIQATNIYQESTKLSIEHPDFANEKLAPKPPRPNDSASLAKYEAYRWYVGNVLFSYETILDALPGDTAWEETAIGFMKGRTEYITTDSVKCDRYSEELQKLMKKAAGSCKCILSN